jgi:NAD(P)-dependent dehydrogenase (short-subunit alcohol dehydrogenase family)
MTETKSPFSRPDWAPTLPEGSRVLVIGASGGIGSALVDMLRTSPGCIIGAHGNSKEPAVTGDGIFPLRQKFGCEADCVNLIDRFCEQAGGIDALVTLSGAIHFSGHWKDMPEAEWQRDIEVNLNQPFFLARAAMRHMTAQKNGGRIVLNGTESALHGGSAQSFPYAIAKRGTEAMVQGLAREGAASGILVNGVRLGYITSGFHQRWHDRTDAQMAERAELVPLKRGGDPAEAAALIAYLLSGWASFITGQMIALTGGDWL